MRFTWILACVWLMLGAALTVQAEDPKEATEQAAAPKVTEAQAEAVDPENTVVAKRLKSAMNMKQLGLGFLMYTGEHEGRFPETNGAAGLQLMRDQEYFGTVDTRNYLNPRDTRMRAAYDAPLTEATVSYAYIGAGLTEDHEHAVGVPILVEKPTDDNWVNVLCIDGHFEGFAVEEKSVEAAVKAFYVRYAKVPAEVQADVLKRARAADAIEKAAKEEAAAAKP